MLPRQQLGGSHHGGLGAGFDRAQHGQQCHHGFARAHIALQQPQHAVRGGEVGVDFRQRAHLRRRERVAEAAQGFGAQVPGAGERAAGAEAVAPAHHRQRHLAGEQFIIGQAAAGPFVRRLGGGLQRGERLDEAGPVFPRQQRRIVPFRQGRQPRQGFGHRAA